MFNLEQAIFDWREQMLAAGIKFPVFAKTPSVKSGGKIISRPSRQKLFQFLRRLAATFFVPTGQWKLASYEVAGNLSHEFIRPERTMDSTVPSGRNYFGTATRHDVPG